MRDNKLQILQHSLGLDQYGEGMRNRNHFVTGPGGQDFKDCNALVGMGLMKDHGITGISGGDNVFTVTPAGIDYVALNSPVRPPAPKLTRSQLRYQEFFHNDGYDSFADFIGVETKCEWEPGKGYRFTEWRKRRTGPWKPTKKEAKVAYKELLKAERDERRLAA